MPYIKQERRIELNNKMTDLLLIADTLVEDELNYIIKYTS